MRTVTVELAGKERLLCFGVKTMLEVRQQYGGLPEWGKALGKDADSGGIGAILWMGQALMEAGARYDRAMGNPPHDVLTADAMADILDMREMLTLQSAVLDALGVGQRRTVGAEPPKNGTATPGDM